MQVAVEGLLYSNFSLQSWCAHTEESDKLVVLSWKSWVHEAVLASFAVFWQWKVYHEADTRPEEGITCSILRNGALFGKACFA